MLRRRKKEKKKREEAGGRSWGKKEEGKEKEWKNKNALKFLGAAQVDGDEHPKEGKSSTVPLRKWECWSQLVVGQARSRTITCSTFQV